MVDAVAGVDDLCVGSYLDLLVAAAELQARVVFLQAVRSQAAGLLPSPGPPFVDSTIWSAAPIHENRDTLPRARMCLSWQEEQLVQSSWCHSKQPTTAIIEQ